MIEGHSSRGCDSKCVSTAAISSCGNEISIDSCMWWIVIGSGLFFGTIVATITTYFMRPMQRPHKMIIDTIEYNLEQLDDLTLEEIDLVKDTVDVLIRHVEELKEKQGRETRR